MILEMGSQVVSYVTSILMSDGYEVCKIAITSILGIRVAITSWKFVNGDLTEEYAKTTGSGIIIAIMYYLLPTFKNIIVGMV